MWNPGISTFEQDILILVSHTTIHNHQWVSFQVGSRIINQVVKNVMDEELRSLSQSWKLASMWGLSYAHCHRLGNWNREFDLNQVKGNVIKTKIVTIPDFQTIVVKGLTKVTLTLQRCSCIGGAIPQVPKHFCPG